MEFKYQKDLKFNFFANVMDGASFGFALGFASFTTMLPLFVSTMTDSAILIGLIPAIHSVGWQLPQLLIARHVSRLPVYKPMVMFMTVHERLPFLALAAIAWLLPALGIKYSLLLTFTLLIWQGLGGGFTATPWQSMIAKIIPGQMRGSFFGMQSAAANLFAGAAAIISGFILETLDSPLDFTLCFLISSVFMVVSWFFLNLTRESPRETIANEVIPIPFWGQITQILRKDKPFRWFLIARMLTQFALMASAFYMVYAVYDLKFSEANVGVLTSVLFITQVVANPILGRLSDLWSKRAVLEVGAVAMTMSALLAWFSKDIGWFYLVIILAGIGFTTYWSIGLALTLQFGNEEERPVYIGLANTLIAPSTILAPLAGGWLADLGGYNVTFFTAAVFGALTVLVLHVLVKDPLPNQSITMVESTD